MTRRSRLLIVDDNPAVLEQAAELVARDFDVVGMLPDGATLREAVEQHRPDIVVLDLTLPGRNGLQLASDLRQSTLVPRVVLLTVHGDADYVRAAFAAGASGYVVKMRMVQDLVPALKAAARGETFVSDGVDADGD
jgi:DNA-binding NarL/FixJ family response regulator